MEWKPAGSTPSRSAAAIAASLSLDPAGAVHGEPLAERVDDGLVVVGQLDDRPGWDRGWCGRCRPLEAVVGAGFDDEVEDLRQDQRIDDVPGDLDGLGGIAASLLHLLAGLPAR